MFVLSESEKKSETVLRQKHENGPAITSENSLENQDITKKTEITKSQNTNKNFFYSQILR